MEDQEAILRDYFPDGYTIVDNNYVAIYPGSRHGMYGDIFCKCICYNMSTGPFVASCMNNHVEPAEYHITYGANYTRVVVMTYYRDITDIVIHKYCQETPIRTGVKLRNHFPVNIIHVPKPRLKINGAYKDIIIKTIDDYYE